MVIITPDMPQAEQPFIKPCDQLFAHQLSTLHCLRELETNGQLVLKPDHPQYQSLANYFQYHHNDGMAHMLGSNLILNTQLGILSSPTGTGKTHPMVALSMEPYSNSTQITNTIRLNRLASLSYDIQMKTDGYLPSTLIVIPKNIYPQWIRVISQAGVRYHGLFMRKDLEELHTIYTNWKNAEKEQAKKAKQDKKDKKVAEAAAKQAAVAAAAAAMGVEGAAAAVVDVAVVADGAAVVVVAEADVVEAGEHEIVVADAEADDDSEYEYEDDGLESDDNLDEAAAAAAEEADVVADAAAPEANEDAALAAAVAIAMKAAAAKSSSRSVEFPRIVLVKHTLYNETVSMFKKWSRVILDEADTINIPGSRPIQAGFTWLVTATAQHLRYHNHKGYWRDIVHSIDRPLLNTLEITIDTEYAIACLHHNTTTEYAIKCQGIQGMVEVGAFLPKKVQDMIAGGDFAAAVKELGGQSHSTESMSDVIINYFNERIKNTQDLIAEAIGLGHKHEHLDERLKILNERKVTTIEKIEKLNADCAICHDVSTDISVVQCCFQTYCTECIVTWMAVGKGQSCPNCRTANPTIMKITQASTPKEKTIKIEEKPSDETKLLSTDAVYNPYQTLPRLLDYIFAVRPSAKVIVVTSYNLQAFQQQLENNQYQFNTLNHVSYKRTVSEFNSGHSPIILLDAKFNGAGIDLEQTTDMIYMQELDPNLMKQTRGRAIRLSRPMNLPLRIYNMRVEGGGEPIDRFRALKTIDPKPFPKPVIKIRPKVPVPVPKIKIV